MNKTFCILPFVHIAADPDGSIKPCCTSFDKIKKENTNTDKKKKEKAELSERLNTILHVNFIYQKLLVCYLWKQ